MLSTKYLYNLFSLSISYSFTINLRLGADKTSDIGFHMCPHYDSRTTVVNDFVDGEWGNQKSLNLFPFKRGIHFDLMLRCDADVFKVSAIQYLKYIIIMLFVPFAL